MVALNFYSWTAQASRNTKKHFPGVPPTAQQFILLESRTTIASEVAFPVRLKDSGLVSRDYVAQKDLNTIAEKERLSRAHNQS